MADFGGNIVEVPIYAMMAKPGASLQFYAYLNPLKSVKIMYLAKIIINLRLEKRLE